MFRRFSAAIVAAGLLSGGFANAHELVCEKTANDANTLLVSTYPTLVNYQFVVSNVHPTLPSVLLSAIDPVLNALIGFTFSPPPPVSIPVSQSLVDHASLNIQSFEACQTLATQDGVVDSFIDNVFTVTFDQGSAQCSARVTCLPPSTLPDGGITDAGVPSSGATRTLGFYKNHEQADLQCLAFGDIDLGAYLFIESSDPTQALIDFLGVLYGSPNKFADGTDRSTLDQKRFLLARQLLVSICNTRLFGTVPTTFTYADAIATLNGTDCGEMGDIQADADAFNNSGDAVPFPPGFVAGPSTPQHAQSIAEDPTVTMPGVCSP